MNSVAIHVIWGNSDSSEWEDVEELAAEPQVSFDWTEFKDVETYKTTIEAEWKSVEIPTGEVVEIMAVFSQDSDNFTMHVRQDKEAIAQILCQGMPSLIFRTLAGETINLQVHEKGAFAEP